MSKRTHRFAQIFLLFLSLMVVSASFYFEYHLQMEPCPLCIMQRVCAILIFMFCLMGICVSTVFRARVISLIQILIAGAGIYFAGRQLWLQSLPPEQTPACMPGLDIMMKYFPWQDVARALFWGAGDCAQLKWQWLGLSMPAWALLYFIFLFLISTFLFVLLRRTLAKISGIARIDWL